MTYRRLPSLSALRCFEAAARHRSVTRAALELHVTPGAVSRQIRALEQELALVLFTRTPVGLDPTLAGESLAASARAAFDGLADGVARASAIRPRHTLRLGVWSLFASRWLIPRLPRLRTRHPELDLVLETSADPLALVPGRYDAVVAVAQPVARPGTVVIPLLEVRTVPVCAPGLLGDGPLDWSGVPLLHTRHRPDDWARWFDAAGLPRSDPHGGDVFETIALAVDAAASGLGVALAIDALVAADLDSGRVLRAHPFHRASSRAFVLLLDAGRAQEPGLAALAAWLRDEAAQA